jgi:hypothetical protein
MSGPDPQSPDDRLLDEFLAGHSEVSQAYRAASDDTAPAALDSAVMQMASEAARRPPAHSARWRLPLAAAAVLVLSFGSLQLIREEPAARRATLMEAEAPTVAMPAPAPETETAAGTGPTAAGEPKDAPAAAAGSRGEDEPRPAQASRKAMAPAASVPEESPSAQASVASEESQDTNKTDDAPGAAFGAAPPPAASRLEQAPRPEAAPPQTPPAPAMDAAAKAETQRMTQQRQRAQSERRERSPEDWLRQIEAMLAAGERQRAIEELQQLRQRHPDFELPADLVNLLPESGPSLRPPGRP